MLSYNRMRHSTRRQHRQHRQRRQRRQHRQHRTRRQRKMRQYGKGIEEWMEPVTAAVQSTFPDVQYTVESSEEEESSISVAIYCQRKIVKKYDENPMISLVIQDNEMFISGLIRCPDTANKKAMRGTDILTQIIAMGKILKPLGIKYIRLHDASSIEYPMLRPNEWCSISLALYKIMTSRAHHSWYNSYGFQSDSYEEEVKNNATFAEQPMMALLRMTSAYLSIRKKNPMGFLTSLTKKSENKNRTSLWERHENATETDLLVKTLLEQTGGAVTPDVPIQNSIEAIHQIALQARSCKDKIVTFYKNIMDAAAYYGIQYNRKLTYTL